MLKIQRSVNGQMVFILGGRMGEENIAELKRLFRSEAEGGVQLVASRTLMTELIRSIEEEWPHIEGQ